MTEGSMERKVWTTWSVILSVFHRSAEGGSTGASQAQRKLIRTRTGLVPNRETEETVCHFLSGEPLWNAGNVGADVPAGVLGESES